MSDPCSKCGGKMRQIPCTDDHVGCCVLHLTCDRCDEEHQRDREREAAALASADRIPQLGGSPRPWVEDCPDELRPDPEKENAERMADRLVPRLRSLPRHSAAWAGVALFCLLLCGGCSQFVLYQHNDYRSTEHPPKANPPTSFPGMFGLSPGLSDLARTAGPGTVVAHSAGATRAVRFAADRGLRLILVDPWPPNIDVPPGVPVCYVVTGRPGRVTVAPGTRLVELTHAGGGCPWAWTVGHIYACRWPESVDAASMAASQARMASAGSSE